VRTHTFVSSLFVSMAMILCSALCSSAQARPPRPGTSGSASSSNNTSTGNSTAGQKTPAGGLSATLVCRMGGSMVWTLVNQFELMQTQINGKTVRVPVVVALFDQLKFTRGGASRDGAALQPGSCGWADRAMTATDPDTLIADADGFTFNETVLWGNGSTIKGETTMSGGSLSFQNKQVFSMQVTVFNGVMLKVVPGTKPKVLSK